MPALSQVAHSKSVYKVQWHLSANHVQSCYQHAYLQVARDLMSPSNFVRLLATTIQLIHVFSSASSVFFPANILCPHF